jgi:hypothetical protein
MPQRAMPLLENPLPAQQIRQLQNNFLLLCHLHQASVLDIKMFCLSGQNVILDGVQGCCVVNKQLAILSSFLLSKIFKQNLDVQHFSTAYQLT